MPTLTPAHAAIRDAIEAEHVAAHQTTPGADCDLDECMTDKLAALLDAELPHTRAAVGYPNDLLVY
jgi:hypothetical protein